MTGLPGGSTLRSSALVKPQTGRWIGIGAGAEQMRVFLLTAKTFPVLILWIFPMRRSPRQLLSIYISPGSLQYS